MKEEGQMKKGEMGDMAGKDSEVIVRIKSAALCERLHKTHINTPKCSYAFVFQGVCVCVCWF